jgi:hypothetical protein
MTSSHHHQLPVFFPNLFQNHPVYIKMNRRSLVSLKLKTGLTDLNIYFFLLFALIQGNGWNDLANFFLMFVIIRMRFLCKEKPEKLSGKLENSGKTESAFL